MMMSKNKMLQIPPKVINDLLVPCRDNLRLWDRIKTLLFIKNAPKGTQEYHDIYNIFKFIKDLQKSCINEIDYSEKIKMQLEKEPKVPFNPQEDQTLQPLPNVIEDIPLEQSE